MASRTNRVHRLRHRPDGELRPGDLELVEEPVPEPGDGQAVIRILRLSLDPTNRIWMSEIRGYMPPVPIDDVMRGLGIGEVVESRNPELPVGALVSGFTGWQEYMLVDDLSGLTMLPDPLPGPLEAFLGALGHTGITAWIGIELFGRPAEGETVVVSAACGAVGRSRASSRSSAGPAWWASQEGPVSARTRSTSSASTPASITARRTGARELDAATPDLIDVDFENVGGPIMDHILGRLAIGARIALCGMISDYNGDDAAERLHGLVNVSQLIMQRATMTGFLVLDHARSVRRGDRRAGGLLAEGRLHYDETIVDGLENAPDTLAQLFDGSNTGKLLIRVAERSAETVPA